MIEQTAFPFQEIEADLQKRKFYLLLIVTLTIFTVVTILSPGAFKNIRVIRPLENKCDN